MKIFNLLTLIILVISSPAFAYIGPGAGLGTIGTVLALIVALILLVVGFVWYPIKRILRGRKLPEKKKDTDKS